MSQHIEKVSTFVEAPKATDDRRNKKYFRTVLGRIEVRVKGLDDINLEGFNSYDHERFFGEEFDRPQGRMPAARMVMKRLLKDGFEDDIDTEIRCLPDLGFGDATLRTYDHEDGFEDRIVLFVNFDLKAERPSEIVSEVEAIEVFDFDDLAQRFASAVDAATAWLRERAEALLHLRETEELSGQIAENAREKAVEATAYKVRFEALRAEFEARVAALHAEVRHEAIQQGRSIVEGWEDCRESAKKGGFGDAAFDSAPKFWMRFLEDPRRPDASAFFGGVGGSVKGSKIKANDLGYSK